MCNFSPVQILLGTRKGGPDVRLRQTKATVQGTVGRSTYTYIRLVNADKMEIAPIDDANVIRESSSSKSSSVSEFEKDIGGAHVIQKSANFEAEESSKMVSESVNQSVNQSVSQSVVQSSSAQIDEKQEFEETTSTTEPPLNDPTAHLIANEPMAPPTVENREDEVERVTELTKSKLTIERQTSTTSLEEQQ
ncbi:hypothetical protein GE061_014367, partial [Apolygus lucorum]